MREMQKHPGYEDGRPETGPMQFGDDWPGVFIRGDNALAYALALEVVLKHPDEAIYRATVMGLIKTLRSADVGNFV